MWIVTNDIDFKMAEGDYGIALPIGIKGFTLGASDSVAIVIKKAKNGDPILTKIFSNIQNNTVNLEFTAEESALLPAGDYVYKMDAYQEGNYLCNLVGMASLKVVDVA